MIDENAIDTGGGQGKGQHTEDRQEKSVQALRRDGTIDDLVEGPYIGNGEIRIETADKRSDSGNKGERIVARVNDELARNGVGSVGKIDSERGILRQSAFSTVADNADDVRLETVLALPEKHLASRRDPR